MEVVILNGITQTAATGLPKTAEGLNALMQRAYNRICLKRGAFCYDRVLGSRFYMLDTADEHAEERALRYAQAALLPLPVLRRSPCGARGGGLSLDSRRCSARGRLR